MLALSRSVTLDYGGLFLNVLMLCARDSLIVRLRELCTTLRYVAVAVGALYFLAMDFILEIIGYICM